MSGPFGDPSDANRKPRGPRPFAGQVHPPGSGPLKSSRVRRPTLAPFPSPFAEQEPEVRAVVPAPVPATAPGIDWVNQPIDADLPATSSQEPVAPAVESTFASLAEAPTEEIPFAAFAHAEPEVAESRADAEEATLSASITADEAQTVSDDIEPQEEFYAEAFGEPELLGGGSDPFAEAEAEPPIDSFRAQELDEEAPFSDSDRVEWSAIDDLEIRPESALHTDELRERDTEGEKAGQEPGMSADAADADDDWFSEAASSSRDGEFEEAPFDRIESVGSTPRSLAAEEAAEAVPELPPVSLPVDWAVSPDGEADLQSYIAEARIREDASEVLEAVARRVRSGEIVLALEPGASPEAVLASVLASLLA